MDDATALAPDHAPRADFPAFRARTPWWGPDLQTVRNLIRPLAFDRPDCATQRLVLPVADGSGDRLMGLLDVPARRAPDAPLVVLIHGLSGSEDSPYVVNSSTHLLGLGVPVLRLNLRGAGPSRETCLWQYHAGRSEDLRDALAALPAPWAGHDLVIVGYSLGGNMLLKFLAEYGADFPIRRAVSVSAPIDLGAASERFLDARNLVYHKRLLFSMKKESLGEGANLTEKERSAIGAVRTILDFDERFVAPRNGFANAAAYYEACSAIGFLMDIRVPTLVIHALDDPWIPGATYENVDWAANPALQPLLPAGGGHVGFHGEGSRIPWHDRCVERWIAQG